MLEIIVKHCIKLSRLTINIHKQATAVATGRIYLDLLLLVAGLNICNGFLMGSEMRETLFDVS